MKYISFQQIRSLSISPKSCVDWVKESFSLKAASQVPAKISVHPRGTDYYTAMPCLLPPSFDRIGLKMVHRVKGALPSLASDILLYEASTGRLLALMDGDWITSMRTGATAVYAAQTFRRDGDLVYGFIGLGNTACATMLCLLESEKEIPHRVLLKRYKDQAERFMERFASYDNVSFEVVPEIPDLIASSDVLYSCVTEAGGLFCEDTSCFRPGLTLIPVHMRGFQNCDLFFDKIYGDDTAPIRQWQYFDRFRHYAELQDVIDGRDPGRESPTERIISYNYGLALHDVFFASRIYEMASGLGLEIDSDKEQEKFWV